MLKAVIAKHMVVPAIEVNKTVVKGAYGKVKMEPVHSIFVSRRKDQKVFTKKVKAKNPLTFEALGQAHGLVIYQTVVKQRLDSFCAPDDTPKFTYSTVIRY